MKNYNMKKIIWSIYFQQISDIYRVICWIDYRSIWLQTYIKYITAEINNRNAIEFKQENIPSKW